MAVTILLETLGGTWESPGVDRGTLRTPEQVSVNGNTGGFDVCSFTLRRDLAPWPDLGAFTPCEIWEDGTLIFEGRIQETPMRRDPDDVLITVSGRGWQYHMDDDAAIELSWRHTNLADWVDTRSLAGARLGATGHFAAAQVNSETAAVAIQFSNGTIYPATGRAGVTLDFKAAELGPERVTVDATTSNNDASLVWYVRSSSSPDTTVLTDYQNLVAGQLIGATNALGGTTTVRRRYMHVFLYRTLGATYASDVWAKISAIACDRDMDSVGLKSSGILVESLPYAPLLSQDVSGIEATTFHWPDFHLTEPRTFREVADAANAAHRWQVKVGQGKRVLFRPQRTVPKYSAPARVFEDASANSGEEIYNIVNVVGTGPDGQPLRVRRHTAQSSPSVASELVSSPAFTNPSFVTNTAGWTVNAGASITRDTGTFHSSPASGFMEALNASGVLTGTLTGTWRRGVAYVLRGKYRPSGGTAIQVRIAAGVGTDKGEVTVILQPSVWTTVDLVWVPRVEQTAPVFEVHLVLATPLYLDSLEVRTLKPTLVDRRGFVRSKRLDVSAPLDAVIANQFGDAFLRSHMKTPMRGSAQIAPGDLTDFTSGSPVHPRVLPAEGGELIHFNDITDPDTGAWGRDGMVASAGYDVDTEVAAVQLDTTRDNLETLIARYASVTGRGGS